MKDCYLRATWEAQSDTQIQMPNRLYVYSWEAEAMPKEMAIAQLPWLEEAFG